MDFMRLEQIQVREINYSLLRTFVICLSLLCLAILGLLLFSIYELYFNLQSLNTQFGQALIILQEWETLLHQYLPAQNTSTTARK